MNTSVQQALTGLLPSLNGPIPSELVALANSLLAQSRNKASSLKQDEEIARPYVCAHLAADRLKQRLNLPHIEPRPPVPPRTYKKVFAYFSTALPVRSSSTPKGVAQSDSREVSLQSPVTKKTTAPSTPIETTPKKRAATGSKLEKQKDDDVPDWSMPLVRQLCKAWEEPSLAPHIFAGLGSIVKFQRQKAVDSTTTGVTSSRGRSRRSIAGIKGSTEHEAIDESDIPALCAVLLFYTHARVSDKETTADQYLQQRETAARTILHTEQGKDIAKSDLLADIERFMRKAQNGWLDLEWYQNIPEGEIDEFGLDEHMPDVEATNKPSTTPKKRKRDATSTDSGALQRGFGTMMQDKVDYLSEDRRRDYAAWKASMMKRIEQIEREDKAAA